MRLQLRQAFRQAFSWVSQMAQLPVTRQLSEQLRNLPMQPLMQACCAGVRAEVSDGAVTKAVSTSAAASDASLRMKHSFLF